ncbi:hypothetical protein T492DRAFT_1084853 [Pavlovales sp. CCMP2436]|nr:hypothetical protein T492DRAFT_1084853 [Pavlovales sp. CCMP2436]
MSVIAASAGGLLGAFCGFDAERWAPTLLPAWAPLPGCFECPGADMALGALFAAGVSGLFLLARLRVRQVVGALAEGLKLLLALGTGTGVGALCGFLLADVGVGESDRGLMADGAAIGAHLAGAVYVAGAAGGGDGLAAVLGAVCAWGLVPGERPMLASGTALALPLLAALLALALQLAALAGRVAVYAHGAHTRGSAAASFAATVARARAQLLESCALAALGAMVGWPASIAGRGAAERADYLSELPLVVGALSSASAVAALLLARSACVGARTSRRRPALKWVFVLEDMYSTRMHQPHLGHGHAHRRG